MITNTNEATNTKPFYSDPCLCFIDSLLVTFDNYSFINLSLNLQIVEICN